MRLGGGGVERADDEGASKAEIQKAVGDVDIAEQVLLQALRELGRGVADGSVAGEAQYDRRDAFVDRVLGIEVVEESEEDL